MNDLKAKIKKLSFKFENEDGTKKNSAIFLNDLFEIPEIKQLIKMTDINPDKPALGINRVAKYIKSMPTDQAIQQLKSELTGRPITEVIGGDLVVTYVC